MGSLRKLIEDVHGSPIDDKAFNTFRDYLVLFRLPAIIRQVKDEFKIDTEADNDSASGEDLRPSSSPIEKSNSSGEKQLYSPKLLAALNSQIRRRQGRDVEALSKKRRIMWQSIVSKKKKTGRGLDFGLCVNQESKYLGMVDNMLVARKYKQLIFSLCTSYSDFAL
ncbi:hypothetical protein BCV71DRAFT_238974 [Rhizopus microsporus]|uniref:Uncharacterized protein n=1 Tax=Rhizopus microsporus TaxID=58291 RepID=A0A1X0RPA1_RHIZD|nr:hypothetical protein BCV71DRAFT_238974 [Rhizopus microsporus]